MLGEPVRGQDRHFFEFDLEDMVPGDHLLRRIDAVLSDGRRLLIQEARLEDGSTVVLRTDVSALLEDASGRS